MDSSGPLPPDDNKGVGILVACWIEAAIGIILLGARFYTRSRIICKIGLDDWTMLFAVVLAIITTVIVTLEVHYGVGRHAAYLTVPHLVKAVQMIWLTAPFSTMSACFGKISIALLLMRIDDRNRSYRIFLWCLIVLLFVVNLLLTIITFAQCTPVYFLWDRLAEPNVSYHGSCWNPNVQKNYGYFQGAFSSFSDLVLALFPILIVWKLQMETRLKIGLAGVMGLGVVATAASIVKTAELKNLSTPDFTWNAVNLVYWYMAENWIIIISACIPTLLPLYMIARGKASVESYRRRGQPSGGAASTWNTQKLRSWFSSKTGSSNGSKAYSSVISSRGDHQRLDNREPGHSMEYIVKEPKGRITPERSIHVRTDVSVNSAV